MNHTNCIIERRKAVTHYTLNMYTGEKKNRVETVEIEPCGTPLFADWERKSGICNSCRSSWAAEGNMPTARGRDQIRRAKQ